jgi:hypothetical protein
MRRNPKGVLLSSIALSIALKVAGAPVAAEETVIETRGGTFTFDGGYPTGDSLQNLLDQMDFQRASQACIWALPIVNLAEWAKAHLDVFEVEGGQFVSYISYEEKLGILTPNYTTPYVVAFNDLGKYGPWVLEIPKATLAGMVMDSWQRSLSDLGVVGPDKGEGGKYLILGPDDEDISPEGFTVLRSRTRGVMVGLRIIDRDNVDEIISKVRSYPYGNEEAALPVVPAGDKEWSQMPPRGLEYWERLGAVLSKEEVEERDRFTLAQLRPLGIEHGKPFEPDERQREILAEAALMGEMMAKANTYSRRFEEPFWEGTRWKDILSVNTLQRDGIDEQLDERAAYFYEAVAISEAMRTTTPGVGQRYVAQYQDKDGGWLVGDRTYRLNVPADPPVEQFWSVTVYDETTRQMIVNDTGVIDRASTSEGMVTNDDGSMDVYFGPEAPEGLESNWVQTNPGEGWFPIFRFYGPTDAFFDKSWKLSDIEKID